MPKYGYLMGECARCGKTRRIRGRRICHTCTWQLKRDGKLEDWPRKTLPMTLIVEEWRHPARAGTTFIEVARDLGLKPEAAYQAYYRARRKGLVA